MKKGVRRLLFVLCFLLLAASVSGCGSDSNKKEETVAESEKKERKNKRENKKKQEVKEAEKEESATEDAEETTALTLPTYAKNEYTLVRNSYDGKVFCYFEDKMAELPGEETQAYWASTTNGTVFRTQEATYLFKDGEIIDIGVSPDAYLVNSPNSDSFLLFSAPEELPDGYNGYSEVSLYQETGQTALFEPDGNKYMISGSWSMDGSLYIYTLYDTTDETYTICLFDGSSSEEIASYDEFVSVLKVSNDGQTAYLRTNTNPATGKEMLYSVTNGTINTLGPMIVDDIFFSYDGADLIFTDGDDRKLSIAGGMPVTLKGEYSYIAPSGTITLTHVKTVGASTFIHSMYYDETSKTVYRINASGEPEVLLEKVSADYLLAEDATTFLYISEGSLYLADLSAASITPQKVVEEDVLYFTASKDASTIAYVDEEERLMFKKGTADPVCILDQAKETRAYQKQHLNSWYGCAVFLPEQEGVYYLDNGDLCYTEDGTIAGTREDFSGDVVYLFAMPGYLTAYTDDNDVIHQYFSLDGIAFLEVIDESLNE
ncbi:MAG: hypothetical protein IJR58_05105 [Lachnospiraceae bacterium]|nr:hypothetical protein [Lachnospiraceae bacterium]